MGATEKTELMLGDCLERLREIAENSIDSIVTDPPYGLEFMGKEWDKFGAGALQTYMTPIFAECFRVLKPGGYLLAFGGSRTYHRLASAVEDAGFTIRDQIMWLHGQGFPKSKDVSKAIDAAAGAERPVVAETKSGGYKRLMVHNAEDGFRPADYYPEGNKFKSNEPITEDAKKWHGWGTALKPAHEPLVLARKPLIGTVAANVLKHGTGALNIDGCRVPSEGGAPRVGEDSQDRRYTAAGSTNFAALPGPRGGDPRGRWPANVIHDGSDEVLETFPDAPGQPAPSVEDGAEQGNQVYGKMKRGGPHHIPRTEQSKSAARFFYCAKANKKDRGEGNNHPTVKPTELMRYLLKLITPPNGKVLDPFMGSGSTGKAAALEGFHFVGIEKEPAYFDIAKQRVEASYALAV